MASLLLDKTLKRYIWKGAFEERVLARDAGFVWDGDRKYWYTYKVADAYKVRSHAEPHLSAIIDAEFHKEERAIKASGALDADINIPLPLGCELLPYQRAGVKYLLDLEDTVYLGGILADEMGLGKTVQAIAATNAIAELNNILIVATKSLLLNWFREFKKWSVHKLNVGIAEGDYVPNTNVVIINYDILHRNREKLEQRRWDVLICDECHNIKNMEAARSRAIFGGKANKKKKLEAMRPLSVGRAYMLTGTPLEGKPIELWPVINFLAPTKFSNYWAYAKRYCGAFKGSWGWDVSGATNLVELQRKLRGAVMIRRKKADVLPELPPKTHQLIELPASRDALVALSAERELEREMQEAARHVLLKDLPYKEAVRQLKSKVYAAFDEISAIRKETALAKLPEAVNFISEALHPGHKMVIFAHHKVVIRKLCEALEAKKVETVSITGETSAKARDVAVSTFQSNPNTQVLIGNIRAAGVGLTLTAASHVVFVELDWTPGAMNQAEDRCHRIGQHDNVLVQVLVLEDSWDARMAKKLIQKEEISDQVTDGLPELQVVLGDDIVNSIKDKEQTMFEKLLDLFTRLVVAMETIASAVNRGALSTTTGSVGTVGEPITKNPDPEPTLTAEELIAKAKWDPRTDSCPSKVVGAKREVLEALLNEMGVAFKPSATGAELYQLLTENMPEEESASEPESAAADDDGFDDLFEDGDEPEVISAEDFRKRIKDFHSADGGNKAKIRKAFTEIDGCTKLSEIAPENFAKILDALGA